MEMIPRHGVARGRVVRKLDLWSIGHEFDSWVLASPLSSATLGKLLTHVPLSPSSIIWYQPMGGDWCLAAGKVTVGLTSHWPRVTYSSGITTYGLMTLEREMSTPPIPSRSTAHFTSPRLGFLWGIFLANHVPTNDNLTRTKRQNTYTNKNQQYIKRGPNKQSMLRYKTKTKPGLIALYDIRPGNRAGLFLQPRSPDGAHNTCIFPPNS